MKRIIGLSIVGALLLIPAAAGASRCDTRLLVWSGTSLVVSGAAPGVSCVTSLTEHYDSNVIYGDTIMVTLDGPKVRSRPFLLAVLNGLGWRNERIVLAWDGTQDRYESKFLTLPSGAQSNGCLKVALSVTEIRGKRRVSAFRDSATYRTPGMIC